MITGTFKTYEVTAGGGTDNIDLTLGYSAYYIKTSGAVTLTSSYTIQAGAGTPVEGMNTQIRYRANLDFNGNTFTVFGASVPNEWQDKQWTADVYYSGSAWEVKFYLDFEETEIVNGDRIEDGTITNAKIESTTGISGTKITDNTLTADAFDETSTWAIRYSKTTIPNASVLTANSAPYTLLSAKASTIIVPLEVLILITGHSAPYATNTVAVVQTDTATNTIATMDCLGTPAGTNPMFRMPMTSPLTGPAQSQFITNKNIEFTVQTGDPTAGDGDIVIYLAYIEIT